ncbi:MAG: hypothetical protein H6668_22790 [Ardenticatenaceae bacterium]|nr:hypothetical protein [Ardenticatenaceae bacterium]
MSEAVARHNGRFSQIYPSWPARSTALLVYLLTLAPDLTWRSYGGDGGELICRQRHPGACRTHRLIRPMCCWALFSLLPIGHNGFIASTCFRRWRWRRRWD